ncbi:hypothetical protein Trco_005842 [Trichoderma cornu-damae]|uniref:Uncharacterized protein n=1 Tax=Trichoderma cornu-damae TaxID=654480 RepID=A0A9P8QK78_9HYPO|nr:hypothetical protein Trco_005842 [Trichoderma cornu-damae]
MPGLVFSWRFAVALESGEAAAAYASCQAEGQRAHLHSRAPRYHKFDMQHQKPPAASDAINHHQAVDAFLVDAFGGRNNRPSAPATTSRHRGRAAGCEPSPAVTESSRGDSRPTNALRHRREVTKPGHELSLAGLDQIKGSA